MLTLNRDYSQVNTTYNCVPTN